MFITLTFCKKVLMGLFFLIIIKNFKSMYIYIMFTSTFYSLKELLIEFFFAGRIL